MSFSIFYAQGFNIDAKNHKFDKFESMVNFIDRRIGDCINGQKVFVLDILGETFITDKPGIILVCLTEMLDNDVKLSTGIDIFLCVCDNFNEGYSIALGLKDCEAFDSHDDFPM